MLPLEQQIKRLEQAKQQIDIAISNCFEAGMLHDEISPNQSNRFWDIRRELTFKQTLIENEITELRRNGYIKELQPKLPLGDKSEQPS